MGDFSENDVTQNFKKSPKLVILDLELSFFEIVFFSNWVKFLNSNDDAPQEWMEEKCPRARHQKFTTFDVKKVVFVLSATKIQI